MLEEGFGVMDPGVTDKLGSVRPIHHLGMDGSGNKEVLGGLVPGSASIHCPSRTTKI